MTASPSADPFDPVEGFEVVIFGGTPPYTIMPKPSPPNPPGVTTTDNQVNVSPAPAPGTSVQVTVTDSSTPPQRAVCTSHTI